MKKKLLFSILSIALLSACSVTPLEAKALTINRQNNTDSNANESIGNGDSEIHTHSYSDDWSADNEHHWHDSTCGHDIISGLSEHSFGDWITSLESTEYKEGKKTRECLVCHFVETKAIPVLDHNHSYSEEWSSNSTHHWHDSICGTDEKKEYEEHSFGDWVVKKEPRDEIEGLKIRTCTKCGYEDKQTIDALPHTHSYSEEWSSNSTHHWHDSTCFDETISNYEEHNFGPWIIDEMPTSYYIGLRHRICTICNYNEQSEVYSITYELDGGETTNPLIYTVDDEVVLSAPTKTGYTFVEWTLNGLHIDKIEKGTTGNLVICAKYSINYHNVTITINDLSKGSALGDGSYAFNSNVVLSSEPIEGYSSNWYLNGEKVSSGLYYSFAMPDKGLNFELHFVPTIYSITYVLNGGVIGNNPDSYTINDEVVLSAPTKTGYTFVEWTLNGQHIEKIEKGTTGNLELVAVFDINTYSIVVSSIDENQGTVDGGGLYEYDSTVLIIATPKPGYKFSGWYKNDSLVSSSASYSFKANDNEEYVAKWSIITYTITYDLNGGTFLEGSRPTTYNVNSSFTLPSAKKTGYTFKGWLKDGEIITKIEKGTTGNLALTASFEIIKYTITVSTNDSSKGTVSGGGSLDALSTATLKATAKSGYVFIGWFENGNVLSKLSDSTSYSFIVEKNINIEAKFGTSSEKTTINNQANGVTPTIDGSIVRFGLYPQNKVNDSVLIDGLNSLTKTQSNGWYLYQGVYYMKYQTSNNAYTWYFDDGTSFGSTLTTYWFKCEPIQWQTLSISNNNYYLLSTKLLDQSVYYVDGSTRTINGSTVYPNNYKESTIRTWLNGTFYNSAFNLGKTNIQTTTVDNSRDTTIGQNEYGNNIYTCANTSDKVFLPSYRDMISTSYGFSSSSKRVAKTTDFARAHHQFNYYCTRSPYGNSPSYAVGVATNGDIMVDKADGNLYVGSHFGVRPAITLKIS